MENSARKTATLMRANDSRWEDLGEKARVFFAHDACHYLNAYNRLKVKL